MGASTHSSRSIKVALANVSLALTLPNDSSVPSIQAQIKENEVKSYWELLSYQLEIIGIQQLALMTKDDKICNLEHEIIKLKEKITRLEINQATGVSCSSSSMPIKNPGFSKEKRLLRSKIEQSTPKSAMTKNTSHPNSDSEEPPHLSPAVNPNPYPLRRATRTSTAGINNSRRPGPTSSYFHLPKIFNDLSPSQSAGVTTNEKFRTPKQHINSSTVRRRRKQIQRVSSTECNDSIKFPAFVQGEGSVARNDSSVSKRPSKSSRNSSKSETNLSAGHASDVQLKKSKTNASTSTSASVSINNKNKAKRARETTSRTNTKRSKRTQSSESVSNNFKNIECGREINEHYISEETVVGSTWKSPLILNESENCLTTKIHYYTLERNEELMDNNYKSLELLPLGDNSLIVEVPSWREKVITKSSYASGIENLDDSVFLKRHQKLELDERRRKRWDAQRLREEQYLAKLKSRSSRRDQSKRHKRKMGSWSSDDGGNESCSNEIETFQPKLHEATCIRVEDDLPISAFGYPIPIVEQAVFELPWDLKPRRPKRSRNEVYYKTSIGNRQHISGIPR